MRTKEQEMSMREREYKVTIQEKDSRIREFEAERKQLQTSDMSIANPPDIINSADVLYLWEGYNYGRGYGYIICKGEKWKKIGSELGFTSEEMEEVISKAFSNSKTKTEKNVSFDDRDINLLVLLQSWIAWYPGDSRGTKTFATYSKLKTALVKAGLGDMARDLIPYKEIKEHVTRNRQL